MDATASTQPAFPHRHTTSSAPGTRMCPMSPAAPSAPRCSVPSASTNPAPMPAPTVTNSTGNCSGGTVRASPSAMRLTSLSTRTGQPSSPPSRSATGKPSQPGMIGGRTAMPRATSTGPGSPTTRTRGRSAGTFACSSRSANWSTRRFTVRSGPSASGQGKVVSASTRWVRSVTRQRVEKVVRSAMSTTPASPARLSRSAGRPLPPPPASSPCNRPASTRSCTCVWIEDRESPVSRDRSRRWDASPAAISRAI